MWFNHVIVSEVYGGHFINLKLIYMHFEMNILWLMLRGILGVALLYLSMNTFKETNTYAFVQCVLLEDCIKRNNFV